jgi:multiple sugar transport system substrate-binding protein
MPDDAAPFRSVSRRTFLASSGWAGLGLAGGSLLAGCTGGSDGGGTITPPSTPPSISGDIAGGSLTWGTWANAGEAERFKRFTLDYAAQNEVKATFRQLPGGFDYLPALLKELKDGTAPDAFYAANTQMASLVASGGLMALNDYLQSPSAKVKFESTYAGLSRWCRTRDGKIHGIVVDANPAVFWFNRRLLRSAGVSKDPAAAFEEGTWNLDALTELLTKIRASDKIPGVIESEWFNWWGYVTSMGGTMIDPGGQAVFDTDAKAMRAITWLIEQLRSGNLVYYTALPKEATVDGLFYAGKLATITYGRWILPNLRKLRISDYDMAPFASEDGKTFAPTPVATAAMSVNANAKNPAVALHFLAKFTNADGQRYRLSGGGNAVPSQPGMDEVVTENNEPEHSPWFTDIATAGYAVPEPFYTSPTKPDEFRKAVDEMLGPAGLGSTTPSSFASRLVSILNG